MPEPDKKPPVSPILVIFLGILSVSTASIFIRFAQKDASSIVIAAYRLILSSLFLVPIAVHRHKPDLKILTRRDMAFGVLSGVFLASHFATWITSLEFTTVASSVVLVWTAPLWVAVLSPITIREPLRKPVLMGMIIAFIGGAIVALSDSCTINGLEINCPNLSQFVRGRAFLGNILALAGALTGAGYLLIGRDLRAKMSLIPYISVVYGIAALVLIGIMIGFGLSPFGYQPITYLWFILLAIFPQLLGHSSFNWALGYLPAAYVSVTFLGEPVGSALLAYLFLDEIPTLLKGFGAILILTGIYIASMKSQVARQSAIAETEQLA